MDDFDDANVIAFAPRVTTASATQSTSLPRAHHPRGSRRNATFRYSQTGARRRDNSPGGLSADHAALLPLMAAHATQRRDGIRIRIRLMFCAASNRLAGPGDR
ncbi:MAG: hypothetical protein BGP05_07930 [Rhizobiales bacterium 62-47]|nr:MAG: hypothetical protein BGP05_07930 [Rhizobiales bacterium 62-47]